MWLHGGLWHAAFLAFLCQRSHMNVHSESLVPMGLDVLMAIVRCFTPTWSHLDTCKESLGIKHTGLTVGTARVSVVKVHHFFFYLNQQVKRTWTSECKQKAKHTVRTNRK